MSTRIAIEGAFGALDRDELDRRVERRARWLRGEGAGPGDRVLVRAATDLPTLETMLATLRLGAVLVPLAEGATAGDVEHVVRTVCPRVRLDHRAPPADPTTPAHVELPDAPAPGDPALVVFTSGTTGKPKGAVLSHDAIDACNRALADAWTWTEADVLSLSLPLFHVHGLCLGLLGSLARGARVIIEPRFSVTRVIEHFDREGDRDAPAGRARATVLFSVPTMIHRLVEVAQREGGAARALAGGRLFVSGSAPLPLRDLVRFRAATGHRVVERYGLTETLMNTANRFVPVASALSAGAEDARALPDHEPSGYRVGSVGRALPGVVLALEDDDARAVAPGEIGEVTIASRSLFAGYVAGVEGARDGVGGTMVLDRGPAMRAAPQRFATGDVGRIDEDGFLWLLGRKTTDVLKSAGFKVGAGEVEAALLEHPSVAECAVVGVADDDLGERIVAVVVTRDVAGRERPEAPELLAHAAEILAPYKRPRAVLLRDALPRNAMGKIQKKALVAELGRSEAPSPPRRDARDEGERP
ncbi:MAG: AMP-binding protein [Deltaproteobacteria bacterium]|nr:AMP-binding protein [Deltaproteobacteria bacterium]